MYFTLKDYTFLDCVFPTLVLLTYPFSKWQLLMW